MDTKNKKEEKDYSEMVTLKPNVIGKEHNFRYVTGTEVECMKCPLGYTLSSESRLIDGHIYIKGDLVI
jgi:hypothetical protein